MKTEKDFYPGWKMTPDQRNKYFNEMGACARKLGRPLEETRQRVHLWAFNEPRSAKDINHLKDFDELKRVWFAIQRGDDLDAQLKQLDMPNQRIIHLIRHDFYRCLAVLLPIKYNSHSSHNSQQPPQPNFHLADGYFNSVLKNRFAGKTIEQLETIQRPIRGGGTKSELDMFRDTIARCISQARQKIDITEHDLAILADIECDCADCRAGIVPTERTAIKPHQQELVAATNENPF